MDINAIELAFLGKQDMLEALFGKPKSTDNKEGTYVDTNEATVTTPSKDARGNVIKFGPALFDRTFDNKKKRVIRKKTNPKSLIKIQPA